MDAWKDEWNKHKNEWMMNWLINTYVQNINVHILNEYKNKLCVYRN
jgi:hypothetical protein